MSIPTLTLDQFLNAAQRFAELALKAYTQGDSEMVLMNAAIAVENLSKALLFDMNPAYLAEPRNGQFDSLLHLTGRGDKAGRPRAPRTIGAREALERVRQVVDIKTPKAELEQLIDVRNGAVHSGLFGPQDTRGLLTIALRYADEVYDALEDRQVLADEPWGLHEDLVTSPVEQQWADVQHEVHRRLTAARANLRDLMDKVPESEQAAVAEARQENLRALLHRRVVPRSDDLWEVAEPVSCPACAFPGAYCLATVHVPALFMRATAVKPEAEPGTLHFRPTHLRCAVCELSLVGEDQLDAVGMSRLGHREEDLLAFLVGQLPRWVAALGQGPYQELHGS